MPKYKTFDTLDELKAAVESACAPTDDKNRQKFEGVQAVKGVDEFLQQHKPTGDEEREVLKLKERLALEVFGIPRDMLTRDARDV